jgi:hypothetical protein
MGLARLDAFEDHSTMTISGKNIMLKINMLRHEPPENIKNRKFHAFGLDPKSYDHI